MQRGISGTEGWITAGILKGLRALRLRTTPSGTAVVQLLESSKAYRAGDIVHLGPGEFQKDQRKERTQ